MHTINIKITPICTACGKELQTSGLEAKSTGHPFERDCPSDRTEQRLYVYACEDCFVFKGDLIE
jgi:hypothetical protein